MNIASELFGTLNKQQVDIYTLSNDNGMELKVMSYGATITSLTIPNAAGGKDQLVCGFDTLEEYFSEEYFANAPYFGCTVGRYCSQIKNAKFSLEGVEYKLAANCGDNNLHGGTIGFDKKIWQVKPVKQEGVVGLEFNLQSRDSDEGFPGNVHAQVVISINNNNEIVFDYSANTDKITPLSMTNHSYFNLSSFKTNVEGCKVKVYTNQLLEMDDTGAATGVVKDVTNTNEDLRLGREIGDVHEAINNGFEHFYVFDDVSDTPRLFAEITDNETGRALEVRTTEPCMLFYSGKYTSNKLKRNSAEQYGKYMGFACETHRYPNGPNITRSPGTFTSPDKDFTSTTVFKLTW